MKTGVLDVAAPAAAKSACSALETGALTTQQFPPSSLEVFLTAFSMNS